MIKPGTLCYVVPPDGIVFGRQAANIVEVVSGPHPKDSQMAGPYYMCRDSHGYIDIVARDLRPISDPDADVSERGKHPVPVAA